MRAIMRAMNGLTRFGRGGIILRDLQPLTNEKIMHYAPSVFAEDRHISRSDKYTYLSTADMLDRMRAEGFHPYEVRQGGSRILGKAEFTKHMIRFRHEATLAEKVGDTFKEVVVVNSHDGTSSYQIMAGLFRLACLNGLVVSNGDLRVLKIAHKGQQAIDDVIEGAYSVIHDSEIITDMVENMQSIELTPPQQVAFARSAGIARWGRDENKNSLAPIEPRHLLQAHRREDTKQDLWTTFNVVQENLVNGGLRYNQLNSVGQLIARRTTKPVQAVRANIQLNQALWELASEMQKLVKSEVIYENI